MKRQGPVFDYCRGTLDNSNTYNSMEECIADQDPQPDGPPWGIIAVAVFVVFAVAVIVWRLRRPTP